MVVAYSIVVVYVYSSIVCVYVYLYIDTLTLTHSPTYIHTYIQTKLSSQDRAAVVIQALVRGALLRTSWAREDAAILMQSIYRGYKARVLLSNMIEDLIKQGEM